MAVSRFLSTEITDILKHSRVWRVTKGKAILGGGTQSFIFKTIFKVYLCLFWKKMPFVKHCINTEIYF